MRINFYMHLLFFLILLSCSSSTVATIDKATIAPIEHSEFDRLLKKYVTTDGRVNYKGFLAEQAAFDAYLQLLADNPPNKNTWSKEKQLAYWINAYNAFTIKLILDHYPTKSIKDLKKGIPFVNSIWDVKFFTIGGKTMDLNEIEHDIIRTEFQEPRIHFAVNCASYSCPHLRNEAYTADRLEEQLSEQTKFFLADKRKNKIDNADKIQLSKIFQWYSTDFTQKGFFSRLFGGKGRTNKLIEFIQPYTDVPLDKNTEIEFMAYDWSLNE